MERPKPKIEWVDSKVTGGHYAFRTERSKKPFQNPMGEATSIEIRPEDIVVDIGAYVGEFSLWCARQGAKRVISYEPTPQTFRVLETNAIEPMELRNMAVVGNDSETAQLFISSGVGVTNSVVKRLRKVGNVEVPAIRYEKAVKDATVVKIDCEGAEYTFDIVQPNLRVIVLEFHPIVGMDWKSRAGQIMDKMEREGFDCIVRPTFKSGWSLTGSWVR